MNNIKKTIIVLIILLICSGCTPNNIDNSAYKDKFYYQCLNSKEKKLYDSFYNTSLRYGSEILDEYYCSEKEIRNTALSFSMDWPEFYWWSKIRIVKNDQNVIKSDFDNYGGYTKGYIKLYDKVDEIISGFTAKTDYKKVRELHDYIINNTYYNELSLHDHKDFLDNNAYTTLVKGEGLCFGYATAFKLIANRMGYDCEIVVGVTQGYDHFWNIIKVDDNWYAIDCDCDDQIGDKGESFLSYEFFFMNDNITRVTNVISSKYKYPRCTDDSYYYLSDENFGVFFNNDKTKIKEFLVSNFKKCKYNMTLRFAHHTDYEYIYKWLFEEDGFSNIYFVFIKGDPNDWLYWDYQYNDDRNIIWVSYHVENEE